MGSEDYYTIMGVSRTASRETIKRAYRKLARKYHPDVSKESQANEKFKQLGEAYAILKDPEKRAKYDQQRQHSNENQAQPSGRHSYEHHDNNENIEDILGSIFGQHSRHGHYQGETFRQKYHEPRRDIHAKLTISLEDSYHGSERTFQLNTPHITSNGETRYKERTVKVKIPKGITDQQQIRLTGQGAEINQKRGDLYIEITLAPHSLYRIENKNIHLTVPISPWEAALGTKITVPTLGGKVSLKLPKFSQTGQQMKLAGRGLPGKPPGNQFIHLEIVIPKNESDESNKLYKQLSETMDFNPRAHLI